MCSLCSLFVSVLHCGRQPTALAFEGSQGGKIASSLECRSRGACPGVRDGGRAVVVMQDYAAGLLVTLNLLPLHPIRSFPTLTGRCPRDGFYNCFFLFRYTNSIFFIFTLFVIYFTNTSTIAFIMPLQKCIHLQLSNLKK